MKNKVKCSVHCHATEFDCGNLYGLEDGTEIALVARNGKILSRCQFRGRARKLILLQRKHPQTNRSLRAVLIKQLLLVGQFFDTSLL